MPHIPVLLDKVVEVLGIDKDKFIVDGTVDGGGHGLEIIKRLGKKGTFLGIDRDGELLKRLDVKLKAIKTSPRIVLSHGSYAELPEILCKENLPKADGLLLDLGFSSDQLLAGKGFSFQSDEPLDMRYDQSKGVTAAEILNKSTDEELADIFFHYGEERFSRRIARGIVERRRREKILTTFQLVEAIRSSVPGNYERGRINPATRVFQALRIYVNSELTELQTILDGLDQVITSGGRVAIISFHSLEDRIVKRSFQSLGREGKINILTKKPLTATEEEISQNPRSRSAKLRVAEII
jgi:16S rRNA (cytosine1402-N4)-methyltransferase